MAYIHQSLSSNPVMKNPDWGIPFIINSSATEVSVAAVLLQNDKPDDTASQIAFNFHKFFTKEFH
jgi:hypothetical protein